MAIFKNTKEKQEATPKTDKISTATIITKGTTISGNIIGHDSVHIDGDIEGNIKVNNTVVVGKSGLVTGNIEAQKIISSGQIDGTITCDELEVLEASIVKRRIDARKVHVFGKIEGDVLCDGLIIEANGVVSDRVEAKSVIVGGSLLGEVACNLLSTKQSGFVKANMFVSNISNEGGKVEGSIGAFKALLSEAKDASKSVEAVATLASESKDTTTDDQ